MPPTRPKRLGRPPSSVSAETRQRIIRAGQTCFAVHGYDKTTNKDIADAAGLTTGALYHYFDSKQTLYLSVLREQQQLVLSAFREAADQAETVLDKLCRVLDRAVELNLEDEHLARFVSIAPIEIARHEEFREANGLVPTRAGGIDAFFAELLEAGRRRGEIGPTVDLDALVSMLLAATSGLAQFAGFVRDTDAHRGVVEAFKATLRSQVFVACEVEPPAAADLQRPRRRARSA